MKHIIALIYRLVPAATQDKGKTDHNNKEFILLGRLQICFAKYLQP
jgi:hypothetical protein